MKQGISEVTLRLSVTACSEVKALWFQLWNAVININVLYTLSEAPDDIPFHYSLGFIVEAGHAYIRL